MSLGASALACNVNPLSAGASSDTTAPRKGPRMTSHTSTAARAQALGHLAFLAIFVGLALFQPAFADYLGKPVIDWVARWLVIPGGIISLVIAGFCAIWRPDYMMKGIYSFVVCLALLFVIKSADFLVNLLQQELG
jgi:protein-S-isoprenylcysteine O-methyltransferase Ste14